MSIQGKRVSNVRFTCHCLQLSREKSLSLGWGRGVTSSLRVMAASNLRAGDSWQPRWSWGQGAAGGLHPGRGLPGPRLPSAAPGKCRPLPEEGGLGCSSPPVWSRFTRGCASVVHPHQRCPPWLHVRVSGALNAAMCGCSEPPVEATVPPGRRPRRQGWRPPPSDGSLRMPRWPLRPAAPRVFLPRVARCRLLPYSAWPR